MKDGLNAAKPLLTRFCVAKSVTYPPNLPDPPRTSLMSPPFTRRSFDSLFENGGDMGEAFLLVGEVRIFCRVRLSHSFCEWNAFRRYALHECRDSACRRPFGVRLRGSFSFYRLNFDICAAPLRMTQREGRTVGYNPFVGNVTESMGWTTIRNNNYLRRIKIVLHTQHPSLCHSERSGTTV